MKEEKKERAQLVAKGTKLVKELKKSEDNMKEARKNYESSVDKQKKTKENLDKEKQKNGSSVPKLQKTLDKDEKKKLKNVIMNIRSLYPI